MKYVGIVFAGLLFAALVHVAMMSPAERARILQVAPAGTADAGPHADAPPSASTDERAAAGADDPPAGTPDVPTRMRRPPVGTGSAPRVHAGVDALPKDLVIPVRGVSASQLSPTFQDARGEGRVHEALDIMAPAGTPVLAVADGHVEKLFDSRQGGLTIYQFEPGGRYAFYYAHLERYAPGLAEGQPLRRGDVIGYVGSTGNADPAAPHLHFAIFVLGPEKRWWQGTPIDPWPLLAGRAR